MEAAEVMRSCQAYEVEPAGLALGGVMCLALMTIQVGKTERSRFGRLENQYLWGQVSHPNEDSC